MVSEDLVVLWERNKGTGGQNASLSVVSVKGANL